MLAQNYVAGSSDLELQYTPDGIAPGVFLGIDLEVFYVWTVTGSTVSVSGGQSGTTPANHTAGAMIRVNPQFSDFAIMNALNNELLDLSSPHNGLYQVKTMDFTYNPVQGSYDLSGVTDLLDILTVRFKTPMPDRRFPSILKWRLDRNQIDAYFPSGYSLTLYQDGFPGQPIYVQYKATFGQMANLTDDVVSLCGLPATAVDIPPMGAIIRLVAGMEVTRNSLRAESDAKRAEEVPPGAVLNSTKALMMVRQERIVAEAARLIQSYSRQGNP